LNVDAQNKMRTVSDCSVCLLKLAQTAARAMGADEALQMKATRAALEVLVKDDFTRVPPAIAGDLLAAVYAALDNEDPFRAIKAEHNAAARALVEAWAPGYLAEARDDDDRLARAVRAALVGNALDLATLPDDADPANFQQWLKAPWAVYNWDDFRTRLAPAREVLYLCDNAGEIAFDRVLVRELLARGKRVTAAVKSGPALNDATLEDARSVGLDDGSVRVITTGVAAMGVDPARAGREWIEAFERADLVIAKGQANLESLHDYGREVFFLTLIKCTHVSRYYGLKKGEAMLYRGGREREKDCG
jgi:damage-control phosphatase, subfamily I